ncbi:TlpA family protein disulfide reductase [Natrarchaeobius sp. A-rgal3]|uniref:TlpA family protein disulfide reductase n=1 Tax=Natrarchaeobius versutus TaxID=1679078 RepID=UPI0035104A25
MTQPSTRRVLLAAAGSSLALAGCLEDGANPDDTETDDASAGGSEEVTDWQETMLEDVTTGESFTIASVDRPVVVHTFAPFCPTCNRQQEEIADSYGDLGDDVQFVDLVIDGNDDPEDVRNHAEENGYEWAFGAAPEPFTEALVDEFGREISVHAQSPLVVVCPDGTTGTVEKVAQSSEIRSGIDDTCG